MSVLKQLDYVRDMIARTYVVFKDLDPYLAATLICLLQSISRKHPKLKRFYMIKPDNGGLRDNKGKVRVELVPPEIVLAVAEVLHKSSKEGGGKYPTRNWERGMAYSTCYACLLRHIFKWWFGADRDEESGLPHLYHVLVNAAFLVTYYDRGIGLDDRPYKEEMNVGISNTQRPAGDQRTTDADPRRTAPATEGAAQ